MKIAIILGTRPEIIKMSPIIRVCEEQELDYFVIHTNQHYSYEMDKIFFEELQLPDPQYNLEVGSGTHGEQTGKMLAGIENILIEEKPTAVLVQGDTNTVLAGALAASKLHIKVGHIEAGLRSYDVNMPEEVNRKLTDHISDYLFAPTEISRQNVLKEGVSDSKIYVLGNTIVDATLQNFALARKNSRILKDLGLSRENFFLLTLHRAENVDVLERLEQILEGLKLVSDKFGIPIVFPIHPRTMKRIEEFAFEEKLRAISNLLIVDPIGYMDFLILESEAKMIFTDSGGVQEEACILKTPCITLRDNTERPETIDVGSNLLVGGESEKIINGAEKMQNVEKDWDNPFGEGDSGLRIVGTLINPGQ
ncbi:MAG: UDP-N-acetylglucosamine 2-epimerase (non-hydrolyzing) [Methanosarcinaceae archaeon]|nr:UDP-N-acetylglucosamine 2-epimerase (non-hydrolyzing) [Methanosarcinaceae archaeon]